MKYWFRDGVRDDYSACAFVVRKSIHRWMDDCCVDWYLRLVIYLCLYWFALKSLLLGIVLLMRHIIASTLLRQVEKFSCLRLILRNPLEGMKLILRFFSMIII